MYEYTWYQWILIFYIYCFFGWIFESAYVSLKERHFVNRGFLRLPMLPLYGTGAVMMLWVSLPLRHNLVLVYLSGLVAATILEYVTGWAMERLFRIRYWDYTPKPFNVNGYICLSSSLAWGVLTVLLTEVLQPAIDRLVLAFSPVVSLTLLSVVSVLFVADTIGSVKAALDLAKVLDAMTRMRAELDDIQVQMSLLKSETSQKLSEMKGETAQRLDRIKEQAAARATERVTELVDNTSEHMENLVENAAGRVAKTAERLEVLSNRLSSLTERRRQLLSHLNFYHRSLLNGNPTAYSAKFGEALRELKERAKHR